MNALILAAVDSAEQTHNELPIPPEAYGVLAFAALISLLFITYAFRSVGTRH